MDNKFLFRPVSPFGINQHFGENKACIDNKTGKVFAKVPYTDEAKCPAGSRSVYSNMKGHNGVDLYATRGTPIFSSQDGIVTEVVDEPDRGIGIGIITKNKFWCIETQSFEYFKIRYWHNLANYKRLGDEVHIGDLIATADNTGYSAGDHLHFELKPVEVIWNRDLKTIESYKNILENNGYFGAVDPMQYMRGQNAVTLQGLKSVYERILWALSL